LIPRERTGSRIGDTAHPPPCSHNYLETNIHLFPLATLALTPTDIPLFPDRYSPPLPHQKTQLPTELQIPATKTTILIRESMFCHI